jgi:hypothetical protein
MRGVSFGLFVLLLLAGAPDAARAATIEIRLRGTLNPFVAAPNRPFQQPLADAFPVAEPFTASIFFDSEAPVTDAWTLGGRNADNSYEGAISEFSIVLTGRGASFDNGAIRVIDDQEFGSSALVDTYAANATLEAQDRLPTSLATSISVPDWELLEARLEILDTTGTMFDDGELPELLPAPGSASFRLIFGLIGSTADASVSFAIDEIAFVPVPEPRAMALVALGLAVLACRSRSSGRAR